MEGLEAGDYGVQIASIRALADLEAAGATEPLIRLLDSNVPEVTIAAAEGLRSLADQIDKGKMLVTARRAGSRFERARALKVLGILGGEDCAVLLLNALDDPDVLVRGAAVSGIANLEEVRAIPKLVDMKKNEANERIIALVRRTLVNLQRIREKKA
jgi:HEAT repeat protein